MLKLDEVNFVYVDADDKYVWLYMDERLEWDGEYRPYSNDYQLLKKELLPSLRKLELGQLYICTEEGIKKCPLSLPPVSLPTNISMAYQWATMDLDLAWYAAEYDPRYYSNDGQSFLMLTRVFDNLEPDPAGWKNSLHKRTADGGWVRVQ